MIDVYKCETMRNPPPAVYSTAKTYGFIGTREELFRQIVVLDAQVCAQAGCGSRLEAVIREQAGQLAENLVWPSITAAQDFLREFLWKNRECFYRMLRCLKVDKAPTACRGAIRAHLLVLLMDGVPPLQWQENIQSLFSQIRPRWHGNIREEIFQDCASLYHDAGGYLTPSDWDQLRQCRSECVQTAKRMLDTVLEIAKREDAVACPAPGPNGSAASVRSAPASDQPASPGPERLPAQAERHRRLSLDSGEEKLRLIYFLENCCASLLEQDIPWRTCAKQNWSDFYPEAVFDKAVEDELWWVLRKRHATDTFGAYCQAIGMAFQYGLKGINSGVHLYNLLLGRAAGMAAAYAPADTYGSPFGGDLDGPLSDAIDYRKRVPVPYAVAAQEEELLLRELLSLYQKDGRYDPALLAGAVPMRKVFRKNFQALEARIREANEGNVLISQMRSQLSDMKSSLEKADFMMKKNLVCHLDRGSFGYRLSQLYRFAQGYDEKDAGQVREMLCALFVLLENEGIRPVYGERLGEEIPVEDGLFDKIIPNMGLEEAGKRVLQYPGWSIGGIQTEPPVYIVVKEQDSLWQET